MNRVDIPVDMESKLVKAGYVPGDDPSCLRDDEWENKYGITRFELTRLRKLHKVSIKLIVEAFKWL
jgi:hypothetical protein